LKRILRIVGIAIVGFVLVVVAYCIHIFGAVSQKEIGRHTNGESSIDAVVVERQGGATTGFVNLIFLVPRGQEPSGEAVFAADRVQGLDVHWRGRDTLVVRADEARAYAHNLKRSIVVGRGGDSRTVNIVFDVPLVD